jgi:hypothetical protein
MVSRDNGRERDPLVRDVRFPLGELVMTPGARDAVPPSEMLQALRRHARADWGDVDAEDWRANDQSIGEGARLLSAYKTSSGVKFWIITEADRLATTVLLPDEY